VALENRAQKSLKYARVARRVSLADSRKYETSKAADRKFRGFFLHKYFLEWFSKLTSCCPATPISSSVPAATWCLGRLWEHSKRYRRNG
jgi:hypothetical protein